MPDLSQFLRISESVLRSRLDAVRAALTHAGEMGRSLEGEFESVLRQILPTEYGLSTGFIAYRKPDGTVDLTSQLDLIIYDAARSGPLARLGPVEVFPLEGVFAYAEVKACLRSDSDRAEKISSSSIEYCLKQNTALRLHRTRHFWVPVSGTQTQIELQAHAWTAIRGYVIAFEATGEVASDPLKLAQRMADYSASLAGDTHLHGLLIVGNAFFKARPVERAAIGTPDQYRIDYVTTDPLMAFMVTILSGLARFPRVPTNWVPAVDKYFDQPTWSTCAPQP